MRALECASLSELKAGQAGSIKYNPADPDFGDPAGLMFQCPCGCGNLGWLAFDNGQNPHPCWRFDGNRERPTLTPSVFNAGMPCRWHGWLRNGEWVSC